jgi:hypothetical protein
MREHHDTVVIGGCQTGLAMSRCSSSANVSMWCWNVGGLVNAGARNEGSFSVPQLGSGRVVVARRMRWVTAAAAASEASGSHMS